MVVELENKTAGELEQIIATTSHLMVKADALLQLSIATQGDNRQIAFEWCKQALTAYTELNNTDLQVTCLLKMAWLTNGAREALLYYEKVLAMATRSQNADHLAGAYWGLGRSYFKLSDFLKSIEWLNKAIAQHTFLRNHDMIAADNNILGTVFLRMGDYLKALECYQIAAENTEKSANRSFYADAMNGMGIVYLDIKDFEKALFYFQKAVSIFTGLKPVPNLCNAMLNAALACENLNRDAEAESYYNQAQSAAESMKAMNSLLGTLSNKSGVLIKNGKYEAASDCLYRASELSKQCNDVHFEAFTLIKWGELYLQRNWEKYDPKASENFFLQALVLSEKYGLAQQINMAESNLANFYKEQCNWEKAFNHLSEYHKGELAINNEEAQRRVANFDIEKTLIKSETEKEVTEKILHNILPRKIAERIRNGEEEIIERYENCSVLFADVVGFTKWSAGMEVKELAKHLNKIFRLFDELAEKHGVEKIKTIGDAYMCVAGLPEPCDDHAQRIALMALAMNETIKENYSEGEIKLRIGIHCGEVIAGVLGKNKYAYDLWGDTVNTASRMESHGVPEMIQVSETFKNQLAGKFQFEERGEVEIKGKGTMRVWFLKNSTPTSIV